MKTIFSVLALFVSFSSMAQGDNSQFDYYAKETVVFAKVNDTEYVSVKRSREGRYGLVEQNGNGVRILEAQTFEGPNLALSLNLTIVSNEYVLWLDKDLFKGFESSGKVKRSFFSKEVLSMTLTNKMSAQGFDKEDEKKIRELLKYYPLDFGSKLKIKMNRSLITCKRDDEDFFVCEHELRATVTNQW